MIRINPFEKDERKIQASHSQIFLFKLYNNFKSAILINYKLIDYYTTILIYNNKLFNFIVINKRSSYIIINICMDQQIFKIYLIYMYSVLHDNIFFVNSDNRVPGVHP